MPSLSAINRLRNLVADRLRLALLLAIAAGVTGISAAASKSAEDFVGPSTMQPLPDAAGKQGKVPAKAAPATAPAKPGAAKALLDTAHIHSIYLEGDFDQALRLLNVALKSKQTLTHNDSVFIYKHLGVIHAATPATREKGRYYMLQLISIEPTAKILDMYASDMIYLIFRNVQEEFESKHGRKVAAVQAVDTMSAPQPLVAKDPIPATAATQKSGRSTLYWVAGGAAVTAGVAGLVFILLDNPKPKKHNIVLEN